ARRAGDPKRGPAVAGGGGRRNEQSPAASGAADASHTPGALDPARAEVAARLAAAHGLAPSDADALASSGELVAFFVLVVAHGAPAQAAANLVVNEVARELRERGDRPGLTPAGVAGAARLLADGTITATAAKEVLAEAAASGADPVELVAARGLDRALPEAEVRRLALEALARHPDEVSSYRAGKQGLRGFFIGQVMRGAGGRADPQVVQRVVGEVLGQE
ncbi:MAG TPA: hypothetical protein VF164_03050, partial [Trueperaceae bacterium]